MWYGIACRIASGDGGFFLWKEEPVVTDMSYLISVLGIAISVGTFFIGRMSASRQQGKADGQMQTMLNNIVEQMHTINAKLDKIDEQILKCVKDIARLEVRVDALEKTRG